MIHSAVLVVSGEVAMEIAAAQTGHITPLFTVDRHGKLARFLKGNGVIFIGDRWLTHVSPLLDLSLCSYYCQVNFPACTIEGRPIVFI